MWTDYLIWIFLIIGLTFNGLGVIGLLRFPDVYTRL
ncbi:MAG: monovalent cation/H(+) antiporter subunit G, partial [Thermoplasmata archaeon]|nr:monovalent cation/H(+) antiporter subunit G [Thermoplasmata archaeon]